MCVSVSFFVSVCYLAATLLAGDWQRVKSCSAFGFTAGVLMEAFTKSHLSSFGRVLVGLAVILPRLCFNMLHFSGT